MFERNIFTDEQNFFRKTANKFLEKEVKLLKDEELKISEKIKLLKSNNLDPDLVSEIAQKKLGLIHQGRVVIKVD